MRAARAGLPEDPRRLVEPSSPRVAGDASTDATHLSQRQDHAPRAEMASKAEEEEESEKSKSRGPASAAPLKDAFTGGVCVSHAPTLPRPAPVSPADSRTGRAGLGASGSRLGVCAAGLGAEGP